MGHSIHKQCGDNINVIINNYDELAHYCRFQIKHICATLTALAQLCYGYCQCVKYSVLGLCVLYTEIITAINTLTVLSY